MTMNGKQDIQLVISRAVAQAIVDYLQTKPYNEVAALIAACGQLQTIEQSGYEKAQPKVIEMLPSFNDAQMPHDAYEGTVAK